MDRLCKKCGVIKQLNEFPKHVCGYRYTCKACKNVYAAVRSKIRRRRNWKGKGGHNKKYHCPLLRKLITVFIKWDHKIKNGHPDVHKNAMTRLMSVSYRKKYGIRKSVAMTSSEQKRNYQAAHRDKDPQLYRIKKAMALEKGRYHLYDWYVRYMLRSSGFTGDIPQELIELKRTQIKLMRLCQPKK